MKRVVKARGPRGPEKARKPTLATLPPEDPPEVDPAEEDQKFETEAEDNKMLVRLGDCRRCQHNLSANADLILVNALKFSYAALADTINAARPRTAAISRAIPINAQQVIQLAILLGAAQRPAPLSPLAGLVWFPQGNFFEQPANSPNPELGRASPLEIGRFFMTATAHAYQLWRRSKQNQKNCCKRHVLAQFPGRRVNIRIPDTVITKKVRIGPRRARVPLPQAPA